MFKYEILKSGSKAVLLLENHLDIELNESALQEMISLLEPYQTVEIDFSRVLFIDSTGIGWLIQLVRALKSGGTDVTIVHISEDIKEVFLLLQLPAILGEEVFPGWNIKERC